MENPGSVRKNGLSRRALTIWGMVFLAAGIVSRSILQKELLRLGEISGEQLIEVMGQSQDAMTYATLALILQAVETCAVPIFAFLLMDGFQCAASFRNYVFKLVGVAVLSEIPYNLAMSGKILDAGTRNPAFGLVLGLVLLYLYDHYQEPSMQNKLLKVLVTVAALLWASMLKIELGAGLTLILCVLWVFRKRPLYRNLAGVTAAVVCTLISPFFLAAPMGFLLIHFYNEEKEGAAGLVSYLAYPFLLLSIGLIALYAI